MTEYTQEQKMEMYKNGEYRFKAPPVCTGRWDDAAWIAFIDAYDGWTPKEPIDYDQVKEAADESVRS